MTKYVIIEQIQYPVYADRNDANIYNNAIVGSSWNTLDEKTQNQYLVMSTRKIDNYQYSGSKVSDTQELKFPRIMTNGTVSDENLLIQLCCQVADYYYTNGTSSSGSDSSSLLNSISKYQIGDMHVDFKDDAKIDLSGLDDMIEQALKDWLTSQSMEIWL